MNNKQNQFFDKNPNFRWHPMAGGVYIHIGTGQAYKSDGTPLGGTVHGRDHEDEEDKDR